MVRQFTIKTTFITSCVLFLPLDIFFCIPENLPKNKKSKSKKKYFGVIHCIKKAVGLHLVHL